MNTSRIMVPLSLTAISLVFLGLSFNIKNNSVFNPTSASFFPALTAVILLGCSVLIWLKKDKTRSFSEDTEDLDKEKSEPQKSGPATNQLKRLGIFLGAVILFAVLMNYVHFLLLSTIYLFVAMSMLNRSRWMANLLTSAITASLIYFLFVNVFEIVFPS